jgi:hypothetical protein
MKADPDTCSEGLLLYPGTLAMPNYRNQYFKAPGIPAGFDVSSISVFAGVPDMVLPGRFLPFFCWKYSLNCCPWNRGIQKAF